MPASEKPNIIDLIGKPFTDGGRGPDSYDCWGLCIAVFDLYGIALRDYALCCHDSAGFSKHYMQAAAEWGWKKYDADNAPAPSIVAIRFNHPVFVNHVGVYIGGGRFLHTREKTGVVVEKIDAVYWKHRIEGFYAPQRRT